MTAATRPLLFAAESAEETGGSLVGFLLPLLIIGGLFYFLLIMPQRKMKRQGEQMRSALSAGDEVRTVGGIYGTVIAVNDDTLVLDIGGGTHLTLAVRAVAQILTDRNGDSEGDDT
jgi:preprotein translocase subunit YajC